MDSQWECLERYTLEQSSQEVALFRDKVIYVGLGILKIFRYSRKLEKLRCHWS